jgi:hypothetical protein
MQWVNQLYEGPREHSLPSLLVNSEVQEELIRRAEAEVSSVTRRQTDASISQSASHTNNRYYSDSVRTSPDLPEDTSSSQPIDYQPSTSAIIQRRDMNPSLGDTTSNNSQHPAQATMQRDINIPTTEGNLSYRDITHLDAHFTNIKMDIQQQRSRFTNNQSAVSFLDTIETNLNQIASLWDTQHPTSSAIPTYNTSIIRMKDIINKIQNKSLPEYLNGTTRFQICLNSIKNSLQFAKVDSLLPIQDALGPEQGS